MDIPLPLTACGSCDTALATNACGSCDIALAFKAHREIIKALLAQRRLVAAIAAMSKAIKWHGLVACVAQETRRLAQLRSIT